MSRFLIPPALVALFTLLGLLIHYTELWRASLLPTWWSVGVGVAFLAVGMGVFVSAATRFRDNGESLAIHVPTESLVSDGVYGVSRNPVYVSFLVMVVGLGLTLNAVAVVAAAVPLFAVLNWYTIPREERYLRRTLGTEYEKYVSRVRRWV